MIIHGQVTWDEFYKGVKAYPELLNIFFAESGREGGAGDGQTPAARILGEGAVEKASEE